MKKNQTLPERIWQFFCSIKLAVYTLILLASTSIIGTIVPQNGAEQYYIEYYGHGWYNLIKALHFDDMYHAWWFLGLIIVLCINIVVCSIERLSTTWKIIFPKKITFSPDRFRKLDNLETITVQKKWSDLAAESETLLSKIAGPVLKEDTGTGTLLYAEKGRWTRMGVYVVHTSLLLLFTGALIGAIFGFRANMKLDEGQTSDTIILSDGKTPVKLEFSIRCNEFNVKFYDTGTPKEFRSNLTILENGKESFTKDIRVNHPLRYKGINIFQSSYGAAPPDSAVFEIHRQKDNQTITRAVKIGEEILLQDNETLFKLEGSLPHYEFNGNNLGQAFIGRITEKGGNSFQIGLPLRFPTFDKMRKGSFAVAVKELDQKYYTGLHITKDPGVWYVYAGFALMIIGCWIGFFMSHQSYFIEIQRAGDLASKVSISGTANRNKHGMKLKLQKILDTIKG